MDNLTLEEKRLPAHERVGLALKLAGVSITVTSITNMFAFLIGATSVFIILSLQMYVELIQNGVIEDEFYFIYSFFRVCQLFDPFAYFVAWASSFCIFSQLHFL